jgi:hypothetical protein
VSDETGNWMDRLVIVLVFVGFTISYSSLQHLAETNGIGKTLSYVWPLLLDFAMVVFALAILRANLRQESAIYAWVLTVIYATLATVANVIDVTTLGLPTVVIMATVKALAPITLALAFHLLMEMFKAEVRRSGVTDSLADLASQVNTKRQELAEVVDSLTGQVDGLSANVESLTVKRADLQAEIKELKNVKSTVNLGNLDTANAARGDQKQQAMADLLTFYADNPDANKTEAGEAIGRSRQTVGNYLAEMASDGRVSVNGKGVKVLT